MAYISAQMGYYEGDRINDNDVEVDPRPSDKFIWNGVSWVEDQVLNSKREKELAVSLLEKTDMVAIRCFKAGVAFPEDWANSVSQLRSFINGLTNVLPELPSTYPENT